MSEAHAVIVERESFAKRHPVVGYFALTCAAAQEVVWYLVYGAVLWAVVVMVMRRGFGRIAADE